MKADWVVLLDGSGAGADRVGGKAASLDHLIRFGFPVPSAFAVTTAAYRSFLAESGLESVVRSLMEAPVPEPAEIAAADAAVVEAFAGAVMPSPLWSAIENASRSLLRTGPVAVRSSATTEDTGAASFAGQHLTVLAVDTIAAVEAAVRRCWASLWSAAARAYRWQEGVTGEPAMAVLIQEMVSADWSGVLFTSDPEGRAGTMRIEAAPGLGDGLVSGRITPQVYRIERDTLRVEPLGTASGLVFLEDLARLGMRVEEVAAEPQDVEWAVGPGGIRVLQSRPITVLAGASPGDDGFDTRLIPDDDYTPLGIGEMLPGPVAPLLWSINGPMVAEALRRMFADLGPVDTTWTRLPVARTSGRAVLNLSVLRDVARAAPGGSAAEVERQYLGHAVTSEERNGGPRIKLRSVLRNWRARRRMADEVALFVEAADTLAAVAPDPRTLEVAPLLAFQAHVRDLAWRGYAAEVAAAGAAGASYRALEMVLGRWLPEHDAAEWAQRLTTGPLGDQAIGSERLRRLEALLAHHAAVTPAIVPAMAAEPGGRAAARIADLGASGEALIAGIDVLLRSFGSRSIYAGAACEEDPGWAWDHLVRYARDGGGSARRAGDPRVELERILTSRKGWRRSRVLTGQIVDIRLHWLRRLAADAAEHLVLRERAKAALLTLGGVERRILRDLARRLTVSGHLADAEDLRFLSASELEWMLRGGEAVPTVELDRRRRAAAAQVEMPALPEVFPGRSPRPAEAPVAGPVLQGWAGSTGTARGRVRVLATVAEGAKLEGGDVIVAHSTDPSWTPLFLRAGALVLEEGGPLSHAAIVAREFGLPAVFHVRGATRILDEGEEVEVDGGLGTVIRTGVAP